MAVYGSVAHALDDSSNGVSSALESRCGVMRTTAILCVLAALTACGRPPPATPASASPAALPRESASVTSYRAHAMPSGDPLFELQGPLGMRGGPVQGEDSHVGRWETNDCTLRYDTWNYMRTEVSYAKHLGFLVEPIRVGGHPASLVTAVDLDVSAPKRYLAGLDSRAPLGLTLFARCRTAASRIGMLRVMRTASFL